MMRVLNSAATFAAPFLAVVATLPPTAPAYGQDRTSQQFTNLSDIDRQVAGFTGSAIGALGGAKAPVDRRLRLARCYGPLALTWHGNRRDTVRVECPDAGGWRIFVATTGGSNGALRMQSAPAKQQTAIKRGEQVSVSVRGRGFSVSRAGEAMEDGAAGEWIKVRPSGSKESVRGRIIRPGLVEIPIG